MAPYVIAILCVAVATAAHGRFLLGVSQVVPRTHVALWLVYEGGTSVMLALSVVLSAPWAAWAAWAAAATAALGALGGSAALASISRRAQLAEIGAAVVRGSHADLQRAEGERAARQLRRWVSSTTSPPSDAPEA